MGWWLTQCQSSTSKQCCLRLKWGRFWNLKERQDFNQRTMLFQHWNNVILTKNQCCFNQKTPFQPRNNIVSMLNQHHFNQKTMLFWSWKPVVSTFKNNLKHCPNIRIWHCFNVDAMSFCQLGWYEVVSWRSQWWFLRPLPCHTQSTQGWYLGRTSSCILVL